MTRDEAGNTPKADRDEAFYQDAFTSMTNWSPGFFEKDCAEHGIEPAEDEWFGLTALRLWEAYPSVEKDRFAANFDAWLMQ